MKNFIGQHTHRAAYNQLRGLIDLCLHIPRESILVEIGSYDGDSTEIWCRGCKEVHAVDPWQWRPDYHPVPFIEAEVVYQQFKDKTARFNNLVIHRATSREAVKAFELESIDVVYIDGFHGYEACLEDIRLWTPIVKVGGLITGHDYLNPDTPGVTKAVQEVFGEPEMYFVDWSWLVTKKAAV